MESHIKTILVTGCTKGIGRAVALKLAQSNCKVYAVGRDKNQLETLAAQSDLIQPICADIAKTLDRGIITQQLEHESAISIIHNAGVSTPAPFAQMTENLLREHFEVNFFAPLLLTQQLLSKLKDQRVLHISSGAALMALESKIPYCTSKGAMHHAMECLQKELGNSHFYFSNLRPGMVDTALQENLRNTNSKILPTQDFYVRAKKEGRLISPEIAATFIAWVMLHTNNQIFIENFWNIYDDSIHSKWLPSGVKIL